MATYLDLKQRALELRKLFMAQELRSHGKVWSRADLMRGFIADVGALSKLSMAADGLRSIDNFQEKLGHEFADCLWSLIVLAEEYSVDLESEFDRLVSEIGAILAKSSKE